MDIIGILVSSVACVGSLLVYYLYVPIFLLLVQMNDLVSYFRFFLLCLNVVPNFVSSGVLKLHPYCWFPRLLWSLALLKIPNSLPQMKSEFWNVLGMSFTNFNWAPSIEIFIRSNIFHINTPFMWPIVFFRWDIKCRNDISKHWSGWSNLWISIFSYW